MASTAAVLNILVTANTGQAQAALTRTDAQLRKTAATANTSSGAMGATIAKGAKTGALAVGALGAASIVAAAKFESSFAEVRKTVEASDRQFDRLERGLRDLAKTIPIPVGELAELAGQAGALGIKAKDLLKFTRTAAELGIATDLSAEQAANALARLSNIMGTSAKDFRRLGSTMVELGNRSAATESEIAEMALRIAGAGKQIGLSESQVLGYAAALASVGVRAEAGGSAISRAFITMA
jgi:TP901 family phage tail tape measure protein